MDSKSRCRPGGCQRSKNHSTAQSTRRAGKPRKSAHHPQVEHPYQNLVSGDVRGLDQQLGRS